MRRARRPLPYPRTYNPAPFSPIGGGDVRPKSSRNGTISVFTGSQYGGWALGAGDSIADVTSPITGVKLKSVGTTAAYMSKTVTLDLGTGWGTDDAIYLRFHVDDVAKLSELLLYFSTDSGYTKTFSNPLLVGALKTGINQIVMRKSQFTVAGAADWAAIVRLRLRITSTAGNDVSVVFSDFTQHKCDLAKGIVCLAFDDGWDTQYTIAKPIMDAYGFPCVISPIVANIGHSGYMTVGQLMDFRRSGSEVGNHGYAHPEDPYYLSYTEAQVDADIRRGYDKLTDLGLEPLDFLVYPGGAYDETVLSVAHRYHNYARAVGNGISERTPQFFPSPLALRAKYGTTAAIIATEVDAAALAVTKGVCLIFMHKVNTTADGLTIATTEFQTAMDHLQSHVAAGEIEVLNWTQTLARMRGEAV